MGRKRKLSVEDINYLIVVTAFLSFCSVLLVINSITHYNSQRKVKFSNIQAYGYKQSQKYHKLTKCGLNCTSNLELLRPYGLDPDNYSQDDEYVLILGSSGLIGSVLHRKLLEKGYKVLHILSRNHRDLRINGSLDIFNDIKIKYIYFLAFEVGGAKYLQNEAKQDYIYYSNDAMMSNVIGWINSRGTKYAFASSSLISDDSAYGRAKKKGEQKAVQTHAITRVFRLWNVYGFEYPNPKSHVIPDFISQCIKYKKVTPLTDGYELRQFLHVDDTCDNLITLMEKFWDVDCVSDLSDGKWVSIRDVVSAIQEVDPNCEFVFPEKKAKDMKRLTPNNSSKLHKNLWQQKYDLKTGIQEVYKKMEEYYNYMKNHVQLSIGIVVDTLSMIEINQIDKIKSKLKELSQNVEINYDVSIIAKEDRMKGKYSFYKSVDEFIVNAKSENIALMKPNIIPTEYHFMFFQRNLTRDDFLYFASTQTEETRQNFTTAKFYTVDSCYKPAILVSIDFVAGKRKTLFKIDDFSFDHFADKVSCGSEVIQFEEPVLELAD